MALSQRLDIKLSQALVMTPQLQQAIKLLQLNNIELTAFVDDELLQNPLLVRADDRDEPAAITVGGDPGGERFGGDGPAGEGAGGDGAGGDGTPGGGDDFDTVFNAEDRTDISDLVASGMMPDADHAPLDTDLSGMFESDGPPPGQETAAQREMDMDPGLGFDAGGPAGRGGDMNFDGDDEGFEARTSQSITLSRHLEDQVAVEIPHGIDRAIATVLIGLLDENGYLTASPAEAAQMMGVEPERVEAVLVRLKGLDPTGVFARDLAECLALQLAERDRLDPAMQALLAHLDLLAQGDRARLRRVTGVDDDDLDDMVREIRALDPRPGLCYGAEPMQTVVPDILLKPRPDGGWQIELNPETLPRVLIDHAYATVISSQVKSKVERDYVSERMQTASWLVKALDQRARTILKVAGELVRQQDGFFAHGIRHLRPLTLRDIADAIGMHESTVSRVTANKYMTTPRGLFELKFFFTAAIATADGQGSVSAEAVRHRIKEMIDSESGTAILSDDKLVELLSADGIDIARRTVAKYREGMGIGSSVQRRRAKMAKR
ncbi:RNA polymerase factor sigma-54 [Tistrella bauzanensis]|uniref:RNA polymerase factor sigma-54 n=1 Tax=Tistrella TaxID=171436 RepID=UPI0031F6BC0E